MLMRSPPQWPWILLCWQSRQVLAQAATSLARPRQTYLEETNCREASLPGCEMLNRWKKCNSEIFPAPLGENLLWRRRQPGVERLLGKKQWWGMNRKANAVFPGSGFAQRPLPRSQLVWPLQRQRHHQSAWGGGGGGGTKICNKIFKPGKYSICILNSETKAKCRRELGAVTRDDAVKRGLWFTQSWNRRPSQKWRKWQKDT